jgi:hypothetical protein
VARKKPSSNRTIQRSIQVVFNIIHPLLILWCFSLSWFVLFWPESWLCVFILKLCSLRFSFSVRNQWKLLAYLDSSWKNEENHANIAWFRGVLKTPVTGVVTGDGETRRRRRPYRGLSSSLSLNLSHLILIFITVRWFPV